MAAPTMPAPPAVPPPPAPPAPVVQSAPETAPVNGWDDPPLGAVPVEEPPTEAKPSFWTLTRKPKTPKAPAAEVAAPAAVAAAAVAPAVEEPKPSFWTLTRKPKTSKAPETSAEVAAPAAAVAAVEQAKPSFWTLTRKPKAPKTPEPTMSGEPEQAAGPRDFVAPVAGAKQSFWTLSRKPKKGTPVAPVATSAAAGVVAGGAVASSMAPVAPAPTSAPTDPVPLAVQPPAPALDLPPAFASPAPPTVGTPVPPGDQPMPSTSGADGASGVTLAKSGSRSNRRSLVLVVLLVLVVAGGAAYVVSKRNNSTPATPAVPATPATSAAADTALAGSINLRLADLPAGWTESAPAEAVVRPPVAPAAAQASATNTMASCLNTSYADVSGLLGSGSLPNQTSLVESPIFQSAAGSSFEMGSKTMILASPGQVQALDGIFTNPKFDLCFQQYAGALAAAAVPGATVQVQPVTLTAPTGVQAYGVVSTYTLAGTGTDVVGDAYLLGGRVVTVLQPSTNGPAIDGDVFSPAYNAVAGRVGAAVAK